MSVTPTSSIATVRIRLDLAYDGTHFRGWAIQPGLRTVEGELTDALSTIVREPVRLTVAGRTDAGVHAAHQVAHVDLPIAAWQAQGADPGEALVRRLNGIVRRSFRGAVGGPGCDVVVRAAVAVDPAFDARFSALGRRYRYRLADTLAGQDPLARHGVTWVPRPIDEDGARAAARALLGRHDFLSFCKPREGATTIRTLTRVELGRGDDGVVDVHVEADAFCHSMVRSIVGALIEVGMGRRDVAWLEGLVARPSREQAAPIAPPEGLTLMSVDYPDDAAGWARRAGESRRRRDEEPCCGD